MQIRNFLFIRFEGCSKSKMVLKVMEHLWPFDPTAKSKSKSLPQRDRGVHVITSQLMKLYAWYVV